MLLVVKTVHIMGFREQVCHLLRRHHDPRVKLGASGIAGAGRGVFAARDIAHRIGDDQEVGTVVCLYPGVFSPGLPFHLQQSSIDGDIGSSTGSSLYLGGEITPCGLAASENAFILNCQETGGYLDGACLSVNMSNGPSEDQTQQESEERWLTQNPSAVGHCVNHGGRERTNVHVVSFRWPWVLEHHKGNKDVDNDADQYDIPNAIRNDGTPWYLDPVRGEIVRHDFPLDHTRADDKKKDENSIHDGAIMPICCGAAFLTLKDIPQGQELLLDYKLQTSPLPLWAEGWYKP